MTSNRNQYGYIWGIPLIVFGSLFLLQNFNIIGSFAEFFLAILYGLGGVLFLTVFQREPRTHWWALIPAFALIGLAMREITTWALPWFAWYIGNSIFLGSMGVGFALIFLFRRDQWWPIIPAGALITLAIEEFLGNVFTAKLTAGIFFAGMGLSFFVVYYLFRTQERLRWTLPVSLGLLVIAAAQVVRSLITWKYLWPLGLIVVGVLLIYRQRPTSKEGE